MTMDIWCYYRKYLPWALALSQAYPDTVTSLTSFIFTAFTFRTSVTHVNAENLFKYFKRQMTHIFSLKSSSCVLNLCYLLNYWHFPPDISQAKAEPFHLPLFLDTSNKDWITINIQCMLTENINKWTSDS